MNGIILLPRTALMTNNDQNAVLTEESWSNKIIPEHIVNNLADSLDQLRE